jgi:hypothetical protein
MTRLGVAIRPIRQGFRDSSLLNRPGRFEQVIQGLRTTFPTRCPRSAHTTVCGTTQSEGIVDFCPRRKPMTLARARPGSTVGVSASAPQQEYVCWSKMQAEASQALPAIIRHKELERRAGGSQFCWGVGNAPSVAISSFSRLHEPIEVIFSIMKSRPKPADVTPSRTVVSRIRCRSSRQSRSQWRPQDFLFRAYADFLSSPAHQPASSAVDPSSLVLLGLSLELIERSSESLWRPNPCFARCCLPCFSAPRSASVG